MSMALPSHSPSHPFGGPGSPSRALNGYSEAQINHSMYGHPRSMLPPSPQHYPPRYPHQPPSAPPPSVSSVQDHRPIPQPNHKRPGSSMSISSMLGGDPENTQPEPYPSHTARSHSRPGSVSGPLMSTNGAMSPPQQISKPVFNEYSYMAGSHTPDRTGMGLGLGITRQRSSSSGTSVTRGGALINPHNRSMSSAPAVRHGEPILPHTSAPAHVERYDPDERVRRTSLSAILQPRPSSQPQPGSTATQPLDAFRAQSHLPTVVSSDRNPPHEPHRPYVPTGFYDTRPPALNGLGKSLVMTQPSPPRSLPHSISPEMRRSSLNGAQSRGLVNLLNGPVGQVADVQNLTSYRMARTDSAQSQGDRSVLGDRGKFRAYSPFAGSFGANADEQGRKGSDELSQHRAIIGLASENKRGRYSPLPQAVHGAQAQTPVPDASAKTDRGRVFSGIGSGVPAAPSPNSFTSSSFKKDEGPMKLSEDNLKNLSRATPVTNKRSRKTHNEEPRDDEDTPNGGKTHGRKKGKHQHNYKADLEEMANGSFLRRSTPQAGSFPSKTAATNVDLTSGTLGYSHQQRTIDTIPVLNPRKKIKVASVFSAASKNARRHLGSFTYRPTVTQADMLGNNTHKFDVSIAPNLLPSFTDPEHVNCTYTVHVPRLWLQPRERSLISCGQHLWGSGIYTDDSDPVAAAIHAGFLKGSIGDGVDAALLAKIIHEQNPTIEYTRDIQVPEQPLEVEQGKDLNITMVVLPLLEKYEGTARFGNRSRSWPEGRDKAEHDGVSFGILKVEFVDIGAEEIRLGRTGQGRRERLRMDLEARRRGFEIQQERITAAKKKRVQMLSRSVSNGRTGSKSTSTPKSVPEAFQPHGTTSSKLSIQV